MVAPAAADGSGDCFQAIEPTEERGVSIDQVGKVTGWEQQAKAIRLEVREPWRQGVFELA